LEFKGDASNGADLNSFHQVGGKSGDLVSESLGGDFSELGKNFFVEVEVFSQFGVVLFNEHLGGLLNGLSSDSTLKKSALNILEYYH